MEIVDLFYPIRNCTNPEISLLSVIIQVYCEYN